MAGGKLAPTHADVAQLVEHFTRNEGVPGSSPGVGLGEKTGKAPETRAIPIPLEWWWIRVWGCVGLVVAHHGSQMGPRFGLF